MYVRDIQQAIDLVHRAVSGKTVAEYECDAILQSAVERQFITIGEALAQLLRLMPALQARISHARQIIAFRNILVHGYTNIANDVVWSALQQDLPVLRDEMDAMLDELNSVQG